MKKGLVHLLSSILIILICLSAFIPSTVVWAESTNSNKVEAAENLPEYKEMGTATMSAEAKDHFYKTVKQASISNFNISQEYEKEYKYTNLRINANGKIYFDYYKAIILSSGFTRYTDILLAPQNYTGDLLGEAYDWIKRSLGNDRENGPEFLYIDLGYLDSPEIMAEKVREVENFLNCFSTFDSEDQKASLLCYKFNESPTFYQSKVFLMIHKSKYSDLQISQINPPDSP